MCRYFKGSLCSPPPKRVKLAPTASPPETKANSKLPSLSAFFHEKQTSVADRTHDVDSFETPLPFPDKPHDSYTTDLTNRFDASKCRVPATLEIESLLPRAFVCSDHQEHLLHMCRAEYYLLDDLENLVHGMDCQEPLPNRLSHTRKLIEIPNTVNEISKEVTMLRVGHDLFDKHFSHLRIDVGRLIRFGLEVGECSPTREDAACVEENAKCRVGFGCCGQDQKELPDGSWEPAETYGSCKFELIKDETDRAEVKAQLADIHDAMQSCHDDLEVNYLGGERHFNVDFRTNKCGLALRQLLGGDKMRIEDCSIQVKCLSRGDKTKFHKDHLNGYWKGYTKTGALCLMLVDAFGELW